MRYWLAGTVRVTRFELLWLGLGAALLTLVPDGWLSDRVWFLLFVVWLAGIVLADRIVAWLRRLGDTANRDEDGGEWL